jgi:hypothetical protein
MKYILLNKETNTIERLIEWDGVATYNPGDNYELINYATIENPYSPVEPHRPVDVGWTYDNGNWIEPPAPPSQNTSFNIT